MFPDVGFIQHLYEDEDFKTATKKELNKIWRIKGKCDKNDVMKRENKEIEIIKQNGNYRVEAQQHISDGKRKRE